jgi:murein DD-endopeptidase MepM/ murein hydrolase activator NlpD
LRRALLVAAALTLGSCGDPRPIPTPVDLAGPTVPATAPSPAAVLVEPTSTALVAPEPSTTLPESTAVPTVATTVATTLPAPTSTPYVIPVADPDRAAWGDTHAAYPASDIFANGCGGTIVSPVNGVLLEVRRVNAYDPAVDNPATRGGRSVAVLGDDGVRYYLAHLELVEEAIEPGVRVAAGDALGTIGTTGRSSACHVHFGISPPCPDREWAVRRGVVWPYRYLDDWRAGAQTSPADEVAAWAAANPNACADAAADPNAVDA